MKKFFATILSAFSLAVALFGAATGLFAQKTPITANAEETAAPTCTAVTDGYSALSHGETLYLFNEKDGGVWQEYAHSAPVSHIEFAQNGVLYFLDEQAALYRLSVADYIDQTNTPAQSAGVDGCTVFCIEGDTLFYSQSTWLCKAPLTDLSAQTKLYDANVTPLFIEIWENELYLLSQVWGMNYIHKLSLNGAPTPTEVARLNEQPTSLLISDGKFYATSKSGNFYHNPLDDFTAVTEYAGDYSALSAHAGKVYLVKENTVYSYTETDGLRQATDGFSRPKLNEIPAAQIKGTVEGGNDGFSVVETKANALLIEVDWAQTVDRFSVKGVSRGESVTALLLAQTENFAVLCHQKAGESEQRIYLISSQQTKEKSGWKMEYPQEKTGYATNGVSLLKYPCAGIATHTPPLTRGEKTAILGEIQYLEQVYYIVRSGEGENAVIGYLPKVYLTDFSGETPPEETVVYNPQKEDGDAVWRLVYILLGCVVICILVDFLILRKKHEE